MNTYLIMEYTYIHNTIMPQYRSAARTYELYKTWPGYTYVIWIMQPQRGTQ